MKVTLIYISGHKIKLLLTSLFIGALSFNSAAQEVTLQHNREVCLYTLELIKNKMDSLISQDTTEFGHLHLGVIDAQNLSIQFKGPLLPVYSEVHYNGVQFGFSNPIERPPLKHKSNYRWIVSDIGLWWHWSWPNSPGFPSDDQARVMATISPLLSEINQLERKAYTSISSSKSKVPRGKGNLKLSLQANDSLNRSVMVKARNSSALPLLLSKLHYSWIVNDSLVIYGLPKGFMYEMSFWNKSECPFTKVAPFSSAEIRQVSLPKLPPGTYRVRLIASFEENRWTDITPTFVDGQPIKHVEKQSWLGSLISDEITLEIP